MMWNKPTDPAPMDALDAAMWRETERVGALNRRRPDRPNKQRDNERVRQMWRTADAFTPEQRAEAIAWLSSYRWRWLGVARIVREVSSWPR